MMKNHFSFLPLSRLGYLSTLLMSSQAFAAEDIVFEDFEGQDWGNWTVTGSAFGSGPLKEAEKPAHQGALGIIGQRGVNSHALAPGNTPQQRDSHIGSLTSPDFTVSRDYIHFFIGGGKRPNLERIRLLDAVTGVQLRMATGHDGNAMRKEIWDISSLQGRNVKLVVEDKYAGGWGNIGVDHIVFSDAQTIAIDGALSVEKWNNVDGFDVSDLVKDEAFFTAPDAQDYSSSSYPSIDKYAGARIRGYLTAPETGAYRFWVSASTSGEIWLSEDETKYRKKRLAYLGGASGSGSRGVALVDGNIWDKYSNQMSEEVELVAGQKYYFEMLTQQHHVANGRHLSVAWARPNQTREAIPSMYLSGYSQELEDSDDDYLPDAWETQYGLNALDNGLTDRLHEGDRGDMDLDGLSNREEYVFGTDPSNPDTDGDGLTDADEVRSYNTNPTQSDAPSEQLVADLDLASYLSGGVAWSLTSEGLIPSSFRGDVSWNFNVPNAGFWTLNVETRLLGDLYLHETLEVEVLIDGVSQGTKTLIFGQSADAMLRILTPNLSAGNHSLTLKIDNMLARRMLSVRRIQLLEPQGADLNMDGYPDWVTTRILGLNSLQSYAPLTRTSPGFLEGQARLIDQVFLNANPVADGVDETHWYADLPLAATGSTSFTVSFESGLSESGAMQWEATNVLDSETLTVRRNDSLKLIAQPANGSTGQSSTLDLPYVNWASLPGVIATQSSTTNGGGPKRAIDGNTNGLWAGGSVTHTASKKFSWLNVNLGADRQISKVHLWNRTNSVSTLKRLSNYRIIILDSSGAAVTSRDFHRTSGYSGAEEVWELPSSVIGRSVHIKNLGKNRNNNFILSLAEVQVFGLGGSEILAADTDHAIYTFHEAGTHLVNATHSDGSTGQLTVHVKQAEFSSIAKDFLGNSIGVLNYSPSSVDSDLSFEGGEAFIIKGSPILSAGNIALQVHPKGRGSYNMVARLYEGGPILNAQALNLIGFSDVIQGDVTENFFSRDFTGYQVISAPIVATGLPPGGKIVINISRNGVTFLDGTKKRTLTAADFVNGTYYIDLLYPIGMPGGYCHYVDIYDRNGIFIARR